MFFISKTKFVDFRDLYWPVIPLYYVHIAPGPYTESA